MSTTYERCDDSVDDLAQEILSAYPEHEDLLAAAPKIDFVFASSDDESKCALKKNGIRCLGIARKISLKDRALGRGDAEIAIDRDYWMKANDAERRALLDHELYHLAVDLGKRDDLGRPIIWLRKHDFEVGWFRVIAKRHGKSSIERQQAEKVMEDSGSIFWPEMFQPELPGLKPKAQKPKAEIAQ